MTPDMGCTTSKSKPVLIDSAILQWVQQPSFGMAVTCILASSHASQRRGAAVEFP